MSSITLILNIPVPNDKAQEDNINTIATLVFVLWESSGCEGCTLARGQKNTKLSKKRVHKAKLPKTAPHHPIVPYQLLHLKRCRSHTTKLFTCRFTRNTLHCLRICVVAPATTKGQNHGTTVRTLQ